MIWAKKPAPAHVISPFPRVRLYLVPVLSTVTRKSLDVMESYWRRDKLTITNASYWTLAIMRSAIDLQQQDTDRVRQGLVFLIREILHGSPGDLLKSMKNNVMLRHFGIIRPNEKLSTVMVAMTDYIKTLELPLASETTRDHTPARPDDVGGEPAHELEGA